MQRQFDAAAKLEKFCNKCKKEKPGNSEVEALREYLKGFRVNMPKKLKLSKDMINKTEEIKKRIDDFYYKTRPILETIESFYTQLKKEPVLFEDCQKDLSKIIEKCKKLIKRARDAIKGTKDVTKLIKVYKKLNVTSNEFESIIKEKRLDEGMIEKLETELETTDIDLDKLLTLEAQIEMVSDDDWATKMKAKIFEAKILLLKTSYEGGKEFKIDLTTLKTFIVEGHQIQEKNPESSTSLKVAEGIWKRVKNKLDQMKGCSVERLQRIKRVLYNCIEVKSEVEDIIHNMLKHQGYNQQLAKKVPGVNEELPNVIKRIKTEKVSLDKPNDNKQDKTNDDKQAEGTKPLTFEERLKAGKYVKDSKKAKLMRLLETNTRVIDDKQKEKDSNKNVSAIAAMDQLNHKHDKENDNKHKKSKDGKSDHEKKKEKHKEGKERDNAEKKRQMYHDQSINLMSKEFVTINPYTENYKMDQESLVQGKPYHHEPENQLGVWSIFDGKFRIDCNNKSFPEISLYTFDSFTKCTEFSQISLNLTFRETTDLEDLNAMFERQINISKGDEGAVLKFLTGYVKADG